MAVPAMPHQRPEVIDAGTGSPRAAALAGQRAMGHHDLAAPAYGAATGRRTVGAVQPLAVETRRRPGVQADAMTTFLSGAAARLEPVAQPVDEAAKKLARAREILAAQPDAIQVLEHRVLETFAALLAPASRSQFAMGQPPVLRLAVRLHRLRLDLLDAPDDAAALVLLVDGEADMRTMRPFSENEGRRMDGEDRATAVALIGTLFGLPPMPGNTELPATFFDDLAAEEVA